MANKKKLTDRITARIEFPPTFLEGVFGSFSVFRSEGEDRCVRYAIGDEALQCYLPVFDHRPGVLWAARLFDREPGPDAALHLVSKLSEPADVEVGRRSGKAGMHPFLTFHPASRGTPRYVVSGSERDVEPETLSAGISYDGVDALWYWLGVLPAAQDSGRGLKLVHLCIENSRTERR